MLERAILETPMAFLPSPLSIDNASGRPFEAEFEPIAELKTGLETSIYDILCHLDEDPSREGLKRTPKRVAETLEYLTSGSKESVSELVAGAIFEAPSEGLVLQKDIEFYSLCEHHMLPFFGKIHVAYVPHKKIIGLSKIPRVVDVYAKRLQVQERLTCQIAEAIESELNPHGVAVIVEASHFCMMMRGIKRQGCITITRELKGCFEQDQSLRAELAQMLKS